MNAAPSASVSVSPRSHVASSRSSPTSLPLLRRPGVDVRDPLLAANTSYQGFPRLAAVLAHDRFFPRQFVNLGDRLVYSNGIVVLAGIAALLSGRSTPTYRADPPLRDRRLHGVHDLAGGMVPLLAAAGTARLAMAGSDQRRGAVATGLVALIVVESKFAQGAWAGSSRSRSWSSPSTASAATTAGSRVVCAAGVSSGRRRPARDEPRRPLRRVVRRRPRGGGPVRTVIAADPFEPSTCPVGTATRDPSALPTTHRDGATTSR